jgi:sulfur relay (sulfurtransferase) DsrC/TusE family protein
MSASLEGSRLTLENRRGDRARAPARVAHLDQTEAHSEVLRCQRDYFVRHRAQVQLCTMIRHVSSVWDPSCGSDHALHERIPRAAPQDPGKRLAGLPRTKREHRGPRRTRMPHRDGTKRWT